MAEEPITAYCVKCREKRPMTSPRPIFMGDAARPGTEGTCPVCGTRLVRFGQTPAHAGLDPAQHVVPSRAALERKAHGPKMVIVESPAKARTVGRFLGKQYVVEASVGHVRDLPSNRMGVDIDNDFEPRYVVPVKKKDVVKTLRSRAGEASELFLATDPDREGEAIAWHLQAALAREIKGIPVHRVEFHEITREAVEQAFSQPRTIDELRVESQQARRILDRVVGYSLSPLLRTKIGRKNLSAGRVQSVALRLICEREREVLAFVPVEYWSIEAELRPPQAGETEQQRESLIARLVKVRGEDPDLTNQEQTQAIVDDLARAAYQVAEISRRERRRYPAPPFMTSTLQQEASRRLGFAARRTMGIAQALYEGKDIGDGERVGLITYMRTDSLSVAQAAQAEARALIAERYGQRYLPPQPPEYKTKAKGAQEAHEAIRPTSVRRDPAALKAYLSRDELRLYTLIWKRFVASQMAPAILDQTSVDVQAGPAATDQPYLLRASGSIVKFPGFLRVYEEGREEEEPGEEGQDVRLPALRQGEALDLVQLLPKQHFTQPPPRYSDASLIRALEEFGIGRPSTYAPTLSTLLDRHYVERAEKKLVPTELGLTVNDLLVAFFPTILDTGFTAEMEKKLDDVATGEVARVPMLREFYEPFATTLEIAQAEMPVVEFKPQPTGEMCPECGRPLVVKLGRYGKFIACSGWPECRHTEPLPVPGVLCPVCGGAVLQKRTRRGRTFYGCANYRPDDESACQWTSWKVPAQAGAGSGPAESE